MGNRALTQVTTTLKEKYRATSKVKVTFDSNAPKIDVRHLYVEVSLVEPTAFDPCYNSEQGSRSEEAVFLKLGEDVSVRGKKIDLCHVFKENDRGEIPETVAIVGPAGSGKTVAVTKKLPLEWANGSFLPGAQLLFVIPVRSASERHEQVRHGDLETTGCSSLEELLGKTHKELHAKSMQEVMTFLAENDDASKVVFIVDGLDEGHIQTNNILYKLIKRKLDGISPKYRVLITARPCPTVKWLREEGIVDRHISLAGFSRKSRDEFFEKYGSQFFSAGWLDMKTKLKTITVQMRDSIVVELLCLPLIATLFMHALPSMSVSDLSHLQNTTELLQSLLLGLLKQDQARTSEIDRATRFSELSGVLQSSLQCLAKHAHDMTVGGEFVFEDIQSDNGESEGQPNREDRRLHQCFTFSFADSATGRSVTQRQFVHLSVQEILCAYHIASKLQNGDGDNIVAPMVGRLAESTNYGGRFTQLFIFLAGMVRSEDLKLVFHAIIRQVCSDAAHDEDGQHRMRKIFRMMLYEASLVKQFNEHDSFLAEAARSLANCSKGYSYEEVYKDRSASEYVHMMRLCQGQFNYLLLDVGGAGSHHLQRMVNAIAQYQPQACHVDVHESVSAQTTETVSGDSGTERGFYDVDISCLCGMVASSDNLLDLGLRFGAVTDDAMQFLWRAVKENRSLQTLQVSSQCDGLPSAAPLLQTICHTNITKLYLGNVLESDWPAICHAVADNDNITHFAVRPHYKLSMVWKTSRIAQLTACLQQNKTLQSLSVRFWFGATECVAEEQLLELMRIIRSHPQLDQVEVGSLFLGLNDSTLVSCMKELIKHDHSRSHTCTRENQASLTPPPPSPATTSYRQFRLPIIEGTVVVVRPTGIRACLEVLASEVDLHRRWHIHIEPPFGLNTEIGNELKKYESIFRPFKMWYGVWLDVPFSMDTVSAPASPTHVGSQASSNVILDLRQTSSEQREGLVDPWKEELFITHFHQRIIKLDPEVLRSACRTKLLLSEHNERELRTMQSKSPHEHNTVLLGHVRQGGVKSFKLFIEVLAELGYSLLEEQLSKFLDRLLENGGVLDLKCLGIDQVDPWSKERFTSAVLPRILDIDPAALRLESVTQGILVPTMDQLLQTVQAQGPLAHNTRLLDFIKPNGVMSFKKFLRVLKKMDYGLIMLEMENLLLATGPV